MTRKFIIDPCRCATRSCVHYRANGLSEDVADRGWKAQTLFWWQIFTEGLSAAIPITALVHANVSMGRRPYEFWYSRFALRKTFGIGSSSQKYQQKSSMIGACYLGLRLKISIILNDFLSLVPTRSLSISD